MAECAVTGWWLSPSWPFQTWCMESQTLQARTPRAGALGPPTTSSGRVLHFDFLPGGRWNPAAASAIMSAVVACFLLGAGSWTYMAPRLSPPKGGSGIPCQLHSCWEREDQCRNMRSTISGSVAGASPEGAHPATHGVPHRRVSTRLFGLGGPGAAHELKLFLRIARPLVKDDIGGLLAFTVWHPVESA